MDNPLRQPDPINPFMPNKLINEVVEGTRHPSRFETKPSVPNTVLIRNDAARVHRAAALSVTTGDTIVWDTVTPLESGLPFDTTGIWNGSTGFVIPATGKVTSPWFLRCQITWPGTGAGTNRQIELRRNGIVIADASGPATTKAQSVTDAVFDPSKGNLYTITVIHDAGGALALTVGSTKMFYSMLHTGV